MRLLFDIKELEVPSGFRSILLNPSDEVTIGTSSSRVSIYVFPEESHGLWVNISGGNAIPGTVGTIFLCKPFCVLTNVREYVRIAIPSNSGRIPAFISSISSQMPSVDMQFML